MAQSDCTLGRAGDWMNHESALATAVWASIICIVLLGMIEVPFRYTGAMVLLLMAIGFAADMKGLR